MKVYTINCPACQVLETKLQQKNFSYETVSDEQIFNEKGLEIFPVLELEDGSLLEYSDAIKWVKEA